MRAALKRIAAVALLSVTAAACGAAAGAGEPIGPPASSVPVPATLGGFKLAQEKDATKVLNDAMKPSGKAADFPYTSDGVVYGIRVDQGKNKELKAVLQISRLRAEARPRERDFRRRIVDQIGRGPIKPQPRGDIQVYERQGNQQFIYLWFVDYLMYVLIIRIPPKDARGPAVDPNRLLNEALAIRPR